MTCQECKVEISKIKDADAVDYGLCLDCFDEPFPITSVCRADLIEYAAKTDIGNLDDGDMIYLASKMADAYMNVFWIDLEILLDFILKDKKVNK